MKLTETQISIVPEQSVIDSWSQLKRTSHQDGCAHHALKCCECLLKEIDDEYLNHTPFDEEKQLKNADEAKFYTAYLEATRYAP